MRLPDSMLPEVLGKARALRDEHDFTPFGAVKASLAYRGFLRGAKSHDALNRESERITRLLS